MRRKKNFSRLGEKPCRYTNCNRCSASFCVRFFRVTSEIGLSSASSTSQPFALICSNFDSLISADIKKNKTKRLTQMFTIRLTHRFSAKSDTLQKSAKNVLVRSLLQLSCLILIAYKYFCHKEPWLIS